MAGPCAVMSLASVLSLTSSSTELTIEAASFDALAA